MGINRPVKNVIITIDFLLETLKNEAQVLSQLTDLPKDIRIIDVKYDNKNKVIKILLESKEWKKVNLLDEKNIPKIILTRS